jgi:glycosyltransferase involved in cell wall biosynthesis
MSALSADVCLVLEGTYPYVAGGVSTWTHDLISAQQDLSFHLLVLVPRGAKPILQYELPPNVAGMTRVAIQELPRGRLGRREVRRLVEKLAEPLSLFLREGGLARLGHICELISPYRSVLGKDPLLDSKAAWELVLKNYQERVPDSSFLDYFWTWRDSLSSLFSVLLCEVPRASLYHPVSTGYAGLLAARAHLETGRPVILTEHGIYTNERRIEIAMAEWLYEVPREELALNETRVGLKELWVELFSSYSKTCYESCEQIITLYEGNQALQRAEGADAAKLRIIPNGIDFERFRKVDRSPVDQPPTVCLIGRVVPIKDVKTFIRSCAILRETVPGLRAFVMGPTEEDPDYFRECLEMAQLLGLSDRLEFTGKVRLEDYLGQVDVVVLTSISEAQPLVILEAGACGIPSVATDVGSCREMILGRSDEVPALGPGGAVTSLSNPEQTAGEMSRLLTDREWYRRCGEAMRTRVQRYYNKADLDKTYHQLYRSLIDSHGKWVH